MLRLKRDFKGIISVLLIISMLLSLTACGSKSSAPSLSDPNEHEVAENVITENIEVENIEVENISTEHITEEIYTEELVEVENAITEMLLEEETISEVVSCQTIYVPEGHIEDFAENSQVNGLFGEGLDIGALLKKVTVGTGIILTLVVLKKVHVPDPVASAIVAGADKSLKFAEGGAVIGSIYGGVTGASDEIDQSGRTSAIIGFATAAVGLILSVVSLIAEVPTGGASTITLAKGIKLVIAGVSVVAATATTAHAGANAVKVFTETDGTEIDWDNVDWDKAGVSAAQRAINNGADGYMWGSIVGAVYGGAEGYDFYQKYNTPYSAYSKRLIQTPKDDEFGHWSGDRGESAYIYDKPKNIKISEDKYVTVEAGTRVTYHNGVPDFSPFQVAQVKIPSMTNNRSRNFRQANEALAEYWTKIKHNNQTWTARDVEAYRTSNGLTWHEMNNMESMQLVPTEINAGFGHLGGVGEYNVMIGDEGVTEFD